MNPDIMRLGNLYSIPGDTFRLQVHALSNATVASVSILQGTAGESPCESGQKHLVGAFIDRGV